MSFFKRRRKKALNEIRKSYGSLKEESYNFELIERFSNRTDSSDTIHELSEAVCNDLDFSLIFEYVDRTVTPIGQQFIYYHLKGIRKNKTPLDQREEEINFFKDNTTERENVMCELKRLEGVDSYYVSDLFQSFEISKPKWLFWAPILSFTMLFSIVMGCFDSIFFLGIFLVLPFNFLIHFLNKSVVNVFLGAIPRLMLMNLVAKKLLKVEFIKKNYAQHLKSVKALDVIKQKVGLLRLNKNMNSDIGIISWYLIEVIKILFLIEPIVFYNITDKIKSKKDQIENVFNLIGAIEMAISIGSLRNEDNLFCIPKIVSTDKPISFVEMRHPLIFNSVANTLKGKEKSLLITGGNMSGKTTFIRSVGLNCWSALTLNTCFAASFSTPFVKIESVIRVNDSIAESKSYFLSEVERISKIVKQSGQKQKYLILIDEIFKGTNTAERIAGAKSILSFLAKQGDYIYATTHDLELAHLLNGEYKMLNFDSTVENGEINFDYTLKEGIQKTGNALKILELSDYPTTVLKESQKIFQTLKSNHER